MTPLRLTKFAMTVLTLATLVGCATLQPLPPTAGGPSATSGTGAPTQGTGGARATQPGTAIVDTVPSPEAVRVLAAIPEPLPPGARVPAPSRASGEGQSAADTTREARADSGASDVPVPAPTEALGERPRPSVMATDSVTAAPRVTPPPSAPATPPASPPVSVATDTCWRVQIAAPSERARAERYRSAAQSLLLVPVVIEAERGLFKVRSQNCTDRAAADAIKRRAVDSGFAGAFRFVAHRP